MHIRGAVQADTYEKVFFAEKSAHPSVMARPFVWIAYCTATCFWLDFRTVFVKKQKKSSPVSVGSPP